MLKKNGFILRFSQFELTLQRIKSLFCRMMKIDDKTGLVLEGGGMRGVFTSGVLDAFMKHGVEFPYIVAVSAGACNGMSYVSRQPGRARYSNIDMMEKYDTSVCVTC